MAVIVSIAEKCNSVYLVSHKAAEGSLVPLPVNNLGYY